MTVVAEQLENVKTYTNETISAVRTLLEIVELDQMEQKTKAIYL